MFQIFPAIDLLNGQCVRLRQGDFEQVTVYENDPIKMLLRFEEMGASWVHVVDLTGAKAGLTSQLSLIEKMTKATNLKLQVGGGLRTQDDVAAMLSAGVERVVVGSMAVYNPEEVTKWLCDYGAEKIVLALDVRLDEKGLLEVLTHGWQEKSNKSLADVLTYFLPKGLRYLLCTDVARDGLLTGANAELYQTIQKQFPDLNIIASGGVKNEADLDALASLDLYGAVTGKAYYEGKIDLPKLLKKFM